MSYVRHPPMENFNITNKAIGENPVVSSDETILPTTEEGTTASKLTKKRLGFIIPELAVVCIIIGGLAANYLPTFLSCTIPSEEAKSNLRTFNNTQLISYITTEKFIDLNEPKHKVHNKHGYMSVTTKTSAYHYALPKDNKSGTFVSAVFVVNQGKENTFKQVLCSIEPGETNYSLPLLKNNMATCGHNTKERWNNVQDTKKT